MHRELPVGINSLTRVSQTYDCRQGDYSLFMHIPFTLGAWHVTQTNRLAFMLSTVLQVTTISNGYHSTVVQLDYRTPYCRLQSTGTVLRDTVAGLKSSQVKGADLPVRWHRQLFLKHQLVGIRQVLITKHA